MAFQSLFDSSSLRSLQILGGADSLLTDPTDAVLHSGDAVLPSSLLDPLPPAGADDTANAAVLNLHSALEQSADQNGFPGLVHGITGTGDSLGLGDLGGDNLLSTVLSAPAGLASGDTSLLGHILPNATSVVSALEGLGSGTASDAGINPAPLGTVGALTSTVQSIDTQGLETLANGTILDLHAALETAGDSGGLPGTVHGITGLGETIGLGEIGGANLLTDVVDLPSALLAGNLGPIENLPHDLSGIVSASTNLLGGVEGDLASGSFQSDPLGHLTAALPALTDLPVDGLANEAINTLHGTLEGAFDPTLPGTIHGVTGLGNAIGLGDLGGSNLLTDATQLPTSALSGNLSPVHASALPISARSSGPSVPPLTGSAPISAMATCSVP